MIVAQRLRGGIDPTVINPRSRTMMYQPTEQYIRDTRASMDTPNLEVRRLNGLGDASSIPSWAPWAAGGLLLGIGAGYALLKMRKKGR